MNTPRLQAALVLLLGAIVLCGAASLRGTEYDEQYTVFLLAGDARPAWPGSVFAVGSVRDRFHGDASPMRIAEDLRDGDVHPPLYFWVVDAWGTPSATACYGCGCSPCCSRSALWQRSD